MRIEAKTAAKKNCGLPEAEGRATLLAAPLLLTYLPREEPPEECPPEEPPPEEPPP